MLLEQHPHLSKGTVTVEDIIQTALLEDLGRGDVTTDNLSQLTAKRVEAKLVARQELRISGLHVAHRVFQEVDSSLHFLAHANNGDTVQRGDIIATVNGSAASILKAERTALNFMQHLSGIATETAKYVALLTGSQTKLLHTRKTTPGLRLLEQQAVLDGGGAPHRFNLGAAVLIKDNHLNAYDGDIQRVVREIRASIPTAMTIELEVDRLEQIPPALAAGVDTLLLDNMSTEQVREAVALIAGKAMTEASGNISFDTIRAYADTGLDYISTSKITMGAPAVDLALDF